MAEKGQIDRIVLSEPSRFARNPQDINKFVQMMADGRIREVHFPNGSIKVTREKLESGERWLLSKMVKAVLGRS